MERARGRAMSSSEEEEVEAVPFASEGPYVGMWIVRSVIEDNSVNSYSVGRVSGYLDASVSDYIKEGSATPLWRVEYVSGDLQGDSEDLEDWELEQSGPRPSRPTDDELRAMGFKVAGEEEKDAEGSSKGESEYEKQRRERIRANEEFLAQLGLSRPSSGGRMIKRRNRRRKENVPEEDRRRSSRACVVHTDRKYDENRAYKMAVSEAKRDHEAGVKRRRDERRQAAAQKRIRHEESHFEQLCKIALSLEKDLTKRSTPDRVAARTIEASEWLKRGYASSPPRGRLPRKEKYPQLGDRCVYFAEGHLEVLRKRRRWEEDDVVEEDKPSWFLQKGAPKVVEVVVAAVMPVAPFRDSGEISPSQRSVLRQRLEALYSTKEAQEWFNEPVDYEGLGLHDYLAVVKEPIDLTTIRSRLNTYMTVASFEADVAKVFKNAIAYNRDDSDVTKDARALLKSFHESNKLFAPSQQQEEDDDGRQHQGGVRLRLVPTYMFDDAILREDDDEKTLTYLTYGDDRDVFVVDAFFVEIRADEIDFLLPVDVVRRASNALSSQKPLAVVRALPDPEKRFETLSVSPASETFPHLPAWKAVKLKPLVDSNRQPDVKKSSRRKRKKFGGGSLVAGTTSRNVWQVKPENRREEEEKDEKKKAPASPVGPPERRSSSRLSVLQQQKIEEEKAAAASKKNKRKGRPTPPPPPPKEAPPAWLKGPFPSLPEDDESSSSSWGPRAAEAMAVGLEAVGQTETGRPYFYPPADVPLVKKQRHSLCCSGPFGRVSPPKPRELRDTSPPSATPAVCFRDVVEALRRGEYRRREAALDDVRRVYYAECTQLALHNTALISGKPRYTKLTKSAIEKRVFNAKLAVQLALLVIEDEEEEATTSNAAARVPWQAYVRRTVGIKTNTGVKIREGVKLAIEAARRDLAGDRASRGAIIAELRLALALYVGNAAGPCRELALKTVDNYGGWHLGAEVSVTKGGGAEAHGGYVSKTAAGKVLDSLLMDDRPRQPPPYSLRVGCRVKLAKHDDELADVVSIKSLNAVCEKLSNREAVALRVTKNIANYILPRVNDGKTFVAIKIDGRKIQCANDFTAFLNETILASRRNNTNKNTAAATAAGGEEVDSNKK